MVQRKTGMNYEQYLTHLADLGHFGYDDRELYESMRDTLEWVYCEEINFFVAIYTKQQSIKMEVINLL